MALVTCTCRARRVNLQDSPIGHATRAWTHCGARSGMPKFSRIMHDRDCSEPSTPRWRRPLKTSGTTRQALSFPWEGVRAMRTFILTAFAAVVFCGTVSAQVSSGSTDAAQQNAAAGSHHEPPNSGKWRDGSGHLAGLFRRLSASGFWT